MKNYLEFIFTFSHVPEHMRKDEDTISFEDASDVFISLLADCGFETFEKNDLTVKAYVESGKENLDEIKEAVKDFPFKETWQIENFEFKEIPGKDWNEEWEKNYFKPIVIGHDLCVIHSSFHHGYPKCKVDIVIDPKMAFGTGNHSTTRLMLQSLFDTPLCGKTVLDVGTGSGILAITASKLGATGVLGVEIDENAWENAVENAELNKCDNIDFLLGTIEIVPDSFQADVLLANINRNIILSDLKLYVRHIKSGGKICLSGFYEHDVPMIIEEASKYGLRQIKSTIENNWTVLELADAK